MILSLRTDKPESEIGLYEHESQVAYEVWQAHRQLAETIHAKINQMLKAQNKTLADITGIVCYKGPGSFTGLRIGLSVANALAYSLQVPIVGIEGEDQWLQRGIRALQSDQNDIGITPAYGAPVHITQPKN